MKKNDNLEKYAKIKARPSEIIKGRFDLFLEIHDEAGLRERCIGECLTEKDFKKAEKTACIVLSFANYPLTD